MDTERYFLPGYRFVYTLVEVDGHPWSTLLTMAQIEQLEPGTVRFVGEAAAEHENFWRQKNPRLFHNPEGPIFVLDTKVVHPHRVESAPRRPFLPWSK